MSREIGGMTKSIYTARYKRLCDLLIKERQRSELTQAQVARALGKQQSFVAKIEKWREALGRY